jgi:hypothetical protein
MLRVLFMVDAVVAGAFGAALVIAPAFVTGLYGAPLDAVGGFLGRLLGGMLVGDALILWQLRNQATSSAGLAVARGHGVFDAIGCAVCAVATVQGLVNPMGWTLVALFAAFGSARLYSGFVAARPAPAAA